MVFFPLMWYDGVRMDLVAMKLPPWLGSPAKDSENPSYGQTLVNIRVGLGPSYAPNARIRFGYAENGQFLEDGPPPCTTRQEACSTEIPQANPSDPYSFMGESRTLRNCATGCTINIPAIPGRVLYYKVDRIESSGNVVPGAGEQVLHAVAVP
jgi:hypothetical protein